MFGWPRDIPESDERFWELRAQGSERIGRQIAAMRDSGQGLDSARIALKEQVEARTHELTRTKAEAARESIEKSIVDLGQPQKKLDEKRLIANRVVQGLESRLDDNGDLLMAYSRRIRNVLDGPAEGLKASLHGLIASLLLRDTEIELALSGVPLREPVRVVSALAPRDRVEHPTGWLARFSHRPRCLGVAAGLIGGSRSQGGDE